MGALIQITNLHKQYGPKILFDSASCQINEGAKLGIIGRNGAGKSTLFNIITGKEEADGGKVWTSPDMVLSYLEQKDTHQPEETVLEFLMRQGYDDWYCGKVAGRFHLKNEVLHKRIEDLPGGFRMRVKLTAMMLPEPNLLLLDEPTNYLDLKTLLLLEGFLREFSGSILVISHDREFLMRTCTETLEVDRGRIDTFPGNLEEYLEYKREVEEQILRENENIEARKKELQYFVDRFRAKASKASQAQSKMKQIARLETKEVGAAQKNVRLVIPSPVKTGGVALRLKNVDVGYKDRLLLKNIDLELVRGGHYAVLGDNGQGKSSFLKTICGTIPALAGEVKWGMDTSVGYYAQHVYEQLSGKQSILAWLEERAPRATTRQEIMNMAGCFLFQGDDTKKPVSVLSGGERSRVLLLSLMLARHDVLLLDEPTNHLDFDTVEVLARALHKFEGTVFIVSHDRTFVQEVSNSILDIKDGTLRLYPGNYDEYVYRLSQTVDAEMDTEEKPEKVKSEKKQAPAQEARQGKKQKDKNQKQARKAYDALGRELEKLQAEQKDLLASVEEKAGSADPKTYERLGELEKQIRETENEWLLLAETLETENVGK
jgi:ATP-binding cassette subfamily F protein 3